MFYIIIIIVSMFGFTLTYVWYYYFSFFFNNASLKNLFGIKTPLLLKRDK